MTETFQGRLPPELEAKILFQAHVVTILQDLKDYNHLTFQTWVSKKYQSIEYTRLIEAMGNWFGTCNGWYSEFDDAFANNEDSNPYDSRDHFYSYSFDFHMVVSTDTSSKGVYSGAFFDTSRWYLDLAATPRQIIKVNQRGHVEFQAFLVEPLWKFNFGGKKDYFLKSLRTRTATHRDR